ncbi:MAG TPA: hypothetical protein VGR76_11180, partial [Candidatus Angelobacter sp.]|nr:hypothetical protein [Candidatus Angelobacter sp.]
MADQEKDKRIDKTLDSLLANYSSAEPRPGLETRILANLKLENLRDAESREAGRGWWGFKWLWAGAVLAALIVVGMLISGKRHVAPPTHTVVQTVQPAVQQRVVPQPAVQQPSVKQPAVQEPLVESSVPKIGARPAIHDRHKTLAPVAQQNATLAVSQRPASFPTPSPLSEQERLM